MNLQNLKEIKYSSNEKRSTSQIRKLQMYETASYRWWICSEHLMSKVFAYRWTCINKNIKQLRINRTIKCLYLIFDSPDQCSTNWTSVQIKSESVWRVWIESLSFLLSVVIDKASYSLFKLHSINKTILSKFILWGVIKHNGINFLKGRNKP